MRIFTIVFILLLSFKIIINTCLDDDEDSTIDPSASSSSCQKRPLSEYEIDTLDAYKCCYGKAKCPDYSSGGTRETKQCLTVTQYEYENIEQIIKTTKQLGCSSVKIQCKSSYLKFALIYFILMIL